MPAGQLAASDITAILREKWDDTLPTDLVMKENAALALTVESDDTMAGEYVVAPILWNKMQGRSATFADAQSNTYGSDFDQFQIPLVENYGVADLSGRVVRQAKLGGSADRLVNMIDNESKMALATIGEDMGHNVYRNIGGARGQVGADSGTVITLLNIDDVVFFEKGMKLKLSTADGTSGAVESGELTVTAVNEDTGELTYTNASATVNVNDYLFVTGDFGLKAAGLDTWVPSSDPSDTLYGVSRASNPQRLGGVRFPGASFQPEELFLRIFARAKRSGIRPSYFLCHPNFYADVETVLQGKREVCDVGTRFEGIGFQGLGVVQGGNGPIPLISDSHCQEDVVWAITGQYWKHFTLGGMPHTIDEDGLEMLRKQNSDGYELRYIVTHNHYTNTPGLHMRTSV